MALLFKKAFFNARKAVMKTGLKTLPNVFFRIHRKPLIILMHKKKSGWALMRPSFFRNNAAGRNFPIVAQMEKY
jgi:hypothetical protein